MSYCGEKRVCSLDANVNSVDNDISMLVWLYEKTCFIFLGAGCVSIA